MAWITLTKAHIEDRLAANELACIEGTGGGDGDRLTGILEQVTLLVRGYVGSCRNNTLGPAGTIPDECLHTACTIAKLNIRATLPSNQQSDPEVREKEYRNAISFLEQVARCEITIDSGNSQSSHTGSACTGGNPKLTF